MANHGVLCSRLSHRPTQNHQEKTLRGRNCSYSLLCSQRDRVPPRKQKSDKVVVVLEKKVFVYNFTDLKIIDQIETCPNLKGNKLITIWQEYAH